MTRINLPPFIVTLGTLSIFLAAGLLYSGGSNIQPTALPDSVNGLGTVIQFGRSPHHHRRDHRRGDRTSYVGFALSQTKWGRHVYAVGNDAEAARLVGIRATGSCSPSTPSPA